MKKAYYLYLLIITLIFFTNGCRDIKSYPANYSRHQSNSYYPVDIENYKSNREKTLIRFEQKPERVIANQQNTIETLLALHQDDSIIAASCTSNHTTEFLKKYESRAKALPNINRYNFDLETALMLKPDFIIGWQSTFSDRVLRGTDFWNKRNVKTYIVENSNSLLTNGTLEDEYRFIANMGKIFNEQESALKIIQEIQNEINLTTLKTRHLEKSKVIILELMGNNITVYGKNRLGGDMVKRLGGDLIDSKGRISAEDLILLDPDVIFVVCIGWKEDAEACVARVKNNKAYRSITAVRENRIYAIPLMYMYASSTRTIDGIKVIKNGLYPELKGL